MAKEYSRPAGRLGLSSDMPAATYKQRGNPESRRPAKVKPRTNKQASTKPRAHRVGRTKR